MRRVVVYRYSDGRSEAYCEGDLVFIKPCSIKEFNKRTEGENADYRWISQDRFSELRKRKFGDKWILARIQYITTDYRGKPLGKIDFVKPNRLYQYNIMYPLGRHYTYLDTKHFDMVKVLNICTVENNQDFRNKFKKICTDKETRGIPLANVVTNNFQSGKRKDLPLDMLGSIVERVNERKIQRQLREAEATPEEVMARNVYPA